MKLTDEHKKAVINRISQLWSESKQCNICGQEKWALSDRLYHSVEMGAVNGETKQLYPMVILTCSHCGQTLFFNAVTIGFSFSSGDAQPMQ